MSFTALRNNVFSDSLYAWNGATAKIANKIKSTICLRFRHLWDEFVNLAILFFLCSFSWVIVYVEHSRSVIYEVPGWLGCCLCRQPAVRQLTRFWNWTRVICSDGSDEQVPMEVEDNFDEGESKNLIFWQKWKKRLWFPQNTAKNKHWELGPFTLLFKSLGSGFFIVFFFFFKKPLVHKDCV